MKIIDFKTVSPFYELCRDGQKPFDIRLVDHKDKRFRALSQIRNQRKPITDYKWVIKFTNPATGESFMRYLTGWEYMIDQSFYCIVPDWIIMYLGEPVKGSLNEL